MTDRINNDITGQAEAKRTEPADSEAYFRRGIAYKKDGDLAAAIADFNEAIRLNPNHADAYFNRGIAHINNHGNYNDLDDLGKAVSDFTRAVQLNPNNANAYKKIINAHNKMAAVYENHGDYDKAIDAYTEIIRLNPNNTNAHNKRDAAYKKKEKPVKKPILYEITQRKATFNYLLTHRVIRDMVFSGPNLFKETILPNPKTLQHFLLSAVANAKEEAERYPDCYEPPYAIEQFEFFYLHSETEGKDIIVVEIPNCENALDCFQIAFPVTDDGVLYFTCELMAAEDGKFWPIVGRWSEFDENIVEKLWAEAQGVKWSEFNGNIAEKQGVKRKLIRNKRWMHENYGDIDVENGQTFADVVAEIVWGEGRYPVALTLR